MPESVAGGEFICDRFVIQSQTGLRKVKQRNP